MTDDKQIAWLTFWLGSDAPKVFRDNRTREKLAEEMGCVVEVEELDLDE